MDKKVKKNLSAALAATIATGVGASAIPVKAAVAAPTADQLYAAAHAATMKVVETAKAKGVKAYFDATNGGASTTVAIVDAVEAGMQKEINAARKAIAALPAELKEAAQTFSSILDNYQHPVYERIVSEINALKAKGEDVRQAQINDIRGLFLDLPTGAAGNYIAETYSSALDTVQMAFNGKVAKAVEAAEKAQTRETLNTAKALVEELATVTNNAGVKDLAAQLDTKVVAVEKIVVEKESVLKVESVTANNLKNFIVNFNKSVDSSTIDIVGSDATIKVYKNGSETALVLEDCKLATDGKSLVVAMPTLNQQDKIKIVVDGVKDAKGEKVVAYEQTLTVTDLTAPSVVSAQMLNSKTLEVVFSEPINTTAWDLGVALRDYLKVDDVAQIASYVVDHTTNKVTFTLGTSLKLGDHTVKVGALVDFATFKTTETVKNVTVVEDKTAPAVSGVTVINPNQIKITFDEPVVNSGTIVVKEAGVDKLAAYSSTSADGKTLTYNLTTALGLASTVETVVEYYGTSDIEGNIAGTSTSPKTFTFVTQDDKVKPTVAVVIGTGNKITLTYSKSMATSGKIIIKDKDNNIVATINNPSFKADTNNTVVEIAAATAVLNNVNVGNYTVTVSDAVDGSIRANKIDTVTTTVTTVDTKNPTLDGVYLTNSSKNEITVYFDEAIQKTMLEDLENYLIDLDGEADATKAYVPLAEIADAKAVAGADGKSVVLTIPGVSDNTDIKVLVVKDTTGNLITNFNTKMDVSLVGTFNEANISNVNLVANNKLEIVSNTKWGIVNPSSFVIVDSDNADAVKLIGVSGEIDSTGLKYTITFNGDLRPDGKLVGGATAKLKTVAGQTTTKDFKGVALSIATAETITDKVAPAVSKIEAITGGSVVITFTEDLGAASTNLTEAELTDIIVLDANGNKVSATTYNMVEQDGVVTITGLTTGSSYKVQVIPESLQDVNSIKVKAYTSSSLTITP